MRRYVPHTGVYVLFGEKISVVKERAGNRDAVCRRHVEDGDVRPALTALTPLTDQAAPPDVRRRRSF